MPKRFQDALAIQQGACNPSGVARSLVAAIDETLDEGEYVIHDPAVRLIAHQLAHILSVRSIDDNLGVYETLTAECKQRVRS